MVANLLRTKTLKKYIPKQFYCSSLKFCKYFQIKVIDIKRTPYKHMPLSPTNRL